MNDNVSQAVQSSEKTLAAIKQHWGWYLLLGTVLIILGVIGVIYSVAVSIIAMVWLGALLLAAGILQCIYAFSAEAWSGKILNLILALLIIATAIYMFMNPAHASVMFTLIIGGFLFVSGILRMIFAIGARKEPTWWLVLISGLISVVLALMIWASWPVSGLWVIGLFISIEVFMTGWSMFFIAIAAKCHK